MGSARVIPSFVPTSYTLTFKEGANPLCSKTSTRPLTLICVLAGLAFAHKMLDCSRLWSVPVELVIKMNGTPLKLG